MQLVERRLQSVEERDRWTGEGADGCHVTEDAMAMDKCLDVTIDGYWHASDCMF